MSTATPAKVSPTALLKARYFIELNDPNSLLLAIQAAIHEDGYVPSGTVAPASPAPAAATPEADLLAETERCAKLIDAKAAAIQFKVDGAGTIIKNDATNKQLAVVQTYLAELAAEVRAGNTA